jgi:hypothetical protein
MCRHGSAENIRRQSANITKHGTLMHVMKSTLFIVGLLCLLAQTNPAQNHTRIPLHLDNDAPSTPLTAPEAGFEGQGYSGPAGGLAVAWHNYRQHRTANDIAPGLVLTWDLPLARADENVAISFRPGLSYLHPTLLIDAVLRLQYREVGAEVAGLSFDPTGDREFRSEESTPEWIWMNEHDSFGKRSFAVLGLQLPTGFAYYEFLYRIQLEKGSHAYYIDAEQSTRTPKGYRRYFLLSAGIGIWL